MIVGFFPAPYPDETFYSWLCRYQKRSGALTHATTLNALFGGRKHGGIGNLFPNNAVHELIENTKLPKDFVTEKDIILNHSAFAYYTRVYDIEEKDKMLGGLTAGRSSVSTNIRKRESDQLRFCPDCLEEQLTRFGEGYWKLSHQLPLVRVCKRHRCRLREYHVSRSARNERFIIPEEVADPDRTTEAPSLSSNDDIGIGMRIAAISEDYLTDDYRTSPNKDRNNLVLGAFNAGYGDVRSKSEGSFIDIKKMITGLTAYYGPECVRKYFGSKDQGFIMYRISKWKYRSVEPYILLSGFLGLGYKDVFCDKDLNDVTMERIQMLKSRRNRPSRIEVAKVLGCDPAQVPVIAKHYGVEPFWITLEGDKHTFIKTYLSPTEKEAVTEYCKTTGYASVSEYVRSLIYRDLDNVLK